MVYFILIFNDPSPIYITLSVPHKYMHTHTHTHTRTRARAHAPTVLPVLTCLICLCDWPQEISRQLLTQKALLKSLMDSLKTKYSDTLPLELETQLQEVNHSIQEVEVKVELL